MCTAAGERQTAAEIELELRAACAIAEVVAWRASRSRAAHELDFHMANVRFFRSDLRRYSPVELAEIVANGAESALWPEIHARLTYALGRTVHAMLQQEMARMSASAREVQSLMSTDPDAALRRIADETEARLREARDALPRMPGDWSATSGVMRFVEESAQLFRAIADHAPPPALPHLGDELRAKLLCDRAFDPWNGMTREEREALYWEAVETFPGSSYVWTRIATFLAEDPARREEALKQLRLAVVLDEEDDEARHWLALQLAIMERYEEALPHFEMLAGRQAPSASAAHLRGICLLELGRVEEAEVSFQQAIALHPRCAGALEGLARCRRARGDEAGAKRLEREAAFHRSGRLPPAR